MSQKNEKKTQSNFLSFEVFAMAFALLCFLGFLCLLTGSLLFGELGEMVRKFFMGAFGYLSFIILLVCIFFSLKAVIGFKINDKKVCRIAKYSAIYALLVAILLQTALTSVYKTPFVDYVDFCYLSGSTFSGCTLGGVVFGVIAWAFCNFLTPVGAYVVYGIALSLTTVILLREKIFSGIYGEKGEKKSSDNQSFIRLKKGSKVKPASDNEQPFQTQSSQKGGFSSGGFGGSFELKNQKGRGNSATLLGTQIPFGSQNNFGATKGFDAPSQPRMDLTNSHSYQSDYDADLQSKIDYVRRPATPQGITVNSPMGPSDYHTDFQPTNRDAAMDIDLSDIEQQTYVVNNGGRSRESIPAFDRRRGDFGGQSTAGDYSSSREGFSSPNEGYGNAFNENNSARGFSDDRRGIFGRDSALGGFEDRASFEPDKATQEDLFGEGYSAAQGQVEQFENSRNPFATRGAGFSRGESRDFGREEESQPERADIGREFSRGGEYAGGRDFSSDEQRRRENLRKLRGEGGSSQPTFGEEALPEEKHSKKDEVLQKLSREGRESAKRKNKSDSDERDSSYNDALGGGDQVLRVYVPKEQEQIAPELKKHVPDEEELQSIPVVEIGEEPQKKETPAVEEKQRAVTGEKLTTESLSKDRQLINPIDNMPKNYRFHFPPYTLLKEYAPNTEEVRRNKEQQEKRKETILQILAQTNIEAKIEDVKVGPALTRFEISIPPNVQIKKVIERQEDLNLWLAAKNKIRIVSPIPGTSRIGIEVPNETSSIVGLKSVIMSRQYREASTSELYFGFGKDTIGNIVVSNIADMPHLLVAGATGTGKSVFLNSLLISLMYKYTPEDLRIIIVDPKVVEFSVYMDLPHLMFNEILTDNQKTCAMLEWVVKEMDERYVTFKDNKVKKIQEYNDLMVKTGGKKMPKILIIIDEFADIMSSSSERKLLENKLNRIAAKARAAGIHVILATQRPSADIVEGSIKTNFVSRIAFKMSSGTDAQVIMNEVGAEKLLGMGDALHRTGKMSTTERAQCAYVSNGEVETICDYIRSHNRCYYNEFALEEINKNSQEEEAPTVVSLPSGSANPPKNDDEIIKQAMRIAINESNVSGSMLQRKLGLGYPKAAKIMDTLVSKGYIGAPIDNRHREIFMTRESFEQTFGEPFVKE